MSIDHGAAVRSMAPATPRIRTVVNVPLILSKDRVVASEIFSFHGLRDQREHFAVKLGNPSETAPPLVRLHSECVTGDVLGSARCDCGPQLIEALERLHDCGGYLLYLRQEGRGIGLYRKLDAYRLQERGHDTYSANRALGHRDDEREYGVAADMLNALDLPRITLLTNNPDKRAQLESAGIEIHSQVPTGVFFASDNRRYLEAKVRHTLHTINLKSHSETFS
jgi:GTP cyclohydrolase II